MQNQQSSQEAETPAPEPPKGEDSVHEPVRNVSDKVIRCEVDIDATRRIRCESGGGFFCFEFTTGAKTQRLKLTDEAAWMVREMLDAMHPRICGSNNSLWHKVQAMRKGDTIPNVRSEVSPPAPGASESTTNRRKGGD